MIKRLISTIIAAAVMIGTSHAVNAREIPEPSGKTYGEFEYSELPNNTLEIKRYVGEQRNVSIPSSIEGKRVTYIGWNAFKTNPTLESAVIPYGVTGIGKWAFLSCPHLSEITIPPTVTSISAYAFAGCNSLPYAVLPDSVRGIGESAFAACPELEAVKLPESVISIDELAFYNCPKLTIYCFEGTAAEAYARANDIPCVLLNPLGIVGDADSDGTLTSDDALSILRAGIGLVTLSQKSETLSDSDGDGEITSADALGVLRKSVGLSANERIGHRIG